MTLEEVLTDLGNDPVSNVPNYRAALAYMNANFTKAKIEVVDGNTPSDKVLEKIYSMEDATLQSLILARPIKEIGNDRSFKNVLLGSAIFLTVIIVAVVLISIFSAVPLEAETIGLFKDIGMGVLEIVKALITST